MTIKIATITGWLFLTACGSGAFLVYIGFKIVIADGKVFFLGIVVDVALFHMQGVFTGFQGELTAFLGPFGMSSLRAFSSRSHVDGLFPYGHLAPVIHGKGHVARRFQRFRGFGDRILRCWLGNGGGGYRKREINGLHMITAVGRPSLIVAAGRGEIPDNMPGFGFRFGFLIQNHGSSTGCLNHFGAGIPPLVDGNGGNSVLNVHGIICFHDFNLIC